MDLGYRKISLAGGWRPGRGCCDMQGRNVDPGCYELKVWVPKTPDSYAEALTPRVTVFGHSADERAIKNQVRSRGWGLNSIGLTPSLLLL